MEHVPSSTEVRRRALEVERRVVDERLIPNLTSPRERESLDPVFGVRQHIAEDVGGEDKEVRGEWATLPD